MNQLEKKIKFGVAWGDWRLSCHNDWYDGPFLDLQVGPFWCVFSRYGLPYIFQEKKDAKGNNASSPEKE